MVTEATGDSKVSKGSHSPSHPLHVMPTCHAPDSLAIGPCPMPHTGARDAAVYPKSEQQLPPPPSCALGQSWSCCFLMTWAGYSPENADPAQDTGGVWPRLEAVMEDSRAPHRRILHRVAGATALPMQIRYIRNDMPTRTAATDVTSHVPFLTCT